MLGDGEPGLHDPEEDEPGSEGAGAATGEARAREGGEKVAGGKEFERVDEIECAGAGEEREGQPVVIEREAELAVQKVRDGAGDAAKDAGQPGDRAAGGGEGNPGRERAVRELCEGKQRCGQE